MNYQEIEPEFTSYVEMVFESDERVGIIFDALANMKKYPDASPLVCLQIAIEDLVR